MIAQVLNQQAQSLNSAANNPDTFKDFNEALFRKWLRQCSEVIFIGVGKSGHICRKAAASFASLGIKSHFIQAAELMHGDLGNISQSSLVIFISFSGKGAEILSAHAQIIKRCSMHLAISAPNSVLANSCAMNIALICDESIPNLPAPTASTTLSLALCDGLLALIASEFNIQQADFAKHHPGGFLGKRFYEKVKDCTQPARIINADASLRDAIAAMSKSGYALIVKDDALVGFLSDGDLRRALEDERFSLDNLAIDFASKTPICVQPDMLAFEAKELAHAKQISTLVVMENERILGVMRMI